MKKLHASSMLIVLTGMLLVAVTAVAFHSGNNEKQVTYYWFDARTGEWLGRQNTLANEKALTGYDESTALPGTPREKGWAPGNVTGFPPIPNASTPDKTLYSHP